MDVIEDLISGTPAVTVKDHPAKNVQMLDSIPCAEIVVPTRKI